MRLRSWLKTEGRAYARVFDELKAGMTMETKLSGKEVVSRLFKNDASERMVFISFNLS
jgi:hypothetical protein